MTAPNILYQIAELERALRIERAISTHYIAMHLALSLKAQEREERKRLAFEERKRRVNEDLRAVA